MTANQCPLQGVTDHCFFTQAKEVESTKTDFIKGNSHRETVKLEIKNYIYMIKKHSVLNMTVIN